METRQQNSSLLQTTRFEVSAVGTAFGSWRLCNAQLASELQTDVEWIARRCGVNSRAVCAPGETTVSLAAKAGRSALCRHDGEKPDLLICATFTPEYQLCPSAPSVAHALDLDNIPAFDVNAACAGGVVGLLVALNFLSAGGAHCVLLVASDTPTRYLAKDDAQTRILFGDGAAALLLKKSPDGGTSLRSWVLGSDGAGAQSFYVPQERQLKQEPSIPAVRMDGRALFRFAVERGSEALVNACSQAGIAPRDVDVVVVHQANLRIIEALQQRTGIAAERWVITLGETGNTGGASVLIALAHLLSSRTLRPGDRVLIGAFGAGLTWAAILIEW